MIPMAKAYVILAHSGAGPLHYDLMLESGSSLATWHVPAPPREMAIGADVAAPRLGDHRRAYLSYQGPVSGGRGCVRRVEAGSYDHIVAEARRWRVRLAGPDGSVLLELRHVGPGEGDWTIRRLNETPE